MKPGDDFGDYRVVRLLGKGGMGEVWLLEDASGTQVAAKILDPAMSADYESRKRFLREAELALGVKHPNLVETYDVGEDPDTGLCYILMEYVSGGTLADRIRTHGALAIDDAVSVVEAMASVLEIGRVKGIVHRDIKPSNIMFDAAGTPKLADLGIARAGAGTETTTVTQTGTMIGTPAYMAPEQMLDAHSVDTRADIYSLGVVFFEMLTGERPNKDDTVVQLMAKAVKGEPLPDVRTLRPEVSAALAQLLAMMVVPNKDGRIATPGQITKTLASMARGDQITKPLASVARGDQIAEPLASVARGERRRVPKKALRIEERRTRFSWTILVPVAILAGLAGAFWFLAPDRVSTGGSSAKPNMEEPVQTNALSHGEALTDGFDEVSDLGDDVVTNDFTRTAMPARSSETVQRKNAAVARVPTAVTNRPPVRLPLGGGVFLELVKCPAGHFTMGYEKSPHPVHRPHRVGISRRFWIGRVPVTLAQWRQIMGTDDRDLLEEERVFGHLNLAVGRRSVAEMTNFCARLTTRFRRSLPKGYVFRFPTDAEWEYACKAGSTDPNDPYVRYGFASASQEREVAVKRQDMAAFFKAKGHSGFAQHWQMCQWPVATRRPNRWGIYDMIGLAGEVVADTFPGFEQTSGSPRRQGMEVKDLGPFPDATDPFFNCNESGAVHLLRCSAFMGQNQTGAMRHWYSGDNRSGFATFRVVVGPVLLKATYEMKEVRMSVPKQGKPLSFSLGKGVTMDFVNCPTGTFVMGWNCDRANFRPHGVTVTRPFWGSVFPVTRDQWNRFMPSKPMSLQERVLGAGRGAQSNVSRAEIDAFCHQLTRKFRKQIPNGFVFRLPTMAELEYMWRAGGKVMTGLYGLPEGLSPDERRKLGLGMEGKREILQKAGCDLTDEQWKNPGRNPTAAVGKGAANPWGMYDFSGNGDQFVFDRFPANRFADRRNGMPSVADLEWPEQGDDPFFWCEDDNAFGVVVMGRDCRAWGKNPMNNSLFMGPDARYGCILFRLVIGPNFAVEAKRRQRTDRKSASAGRDRKTASSANLAFTDAEIESMKGARGDKAMQRVFDRLFPGWRVSSCGGVVGEGWNRVGFLPEFDDRSNLCSTLPKDNRRPMKVSKTVLVSDKELRLYFSVRKTPGDAGFMLEVFVDGKSVKEFSVHDDKWLDGSLDLRPWTGKKVRLELRQSKMPDRQNARAVWSRLEVL